MSSATKDPSKYHRMNRWLGQMIETVAAFKELVEGGVPEAGTRYQHHLDLLKELQSEQRMPDSVQDLIQELLEMFASTEQTLNELANQLED